MKIKRDHELPERLRKISMFAKNMASQIQPQIYNALVGELNKMGAPFTAQEQLAGLGNFLNIFCCQWVVAMKDICEADDNDISTQELLEQVLSGIAASFNSKLVPREAPMPGGIKRLNKS